MGDHPKLYPDERGVRLALGQIKTKINKGEYGYRDTTWDEAKDDYEIVEVTISIDRTLP